MARKVFFSFHFGKDSQRAAQVRNADMLTDEDEYGVIDAVDWEKLEREGAESVRCWILSQLEGTSVTVVLIGAETANRPWVKYEIRKSWERGNALIGLKIHNVKNLKGETDLPGINPLEQMKFIDGTTLSSVSKTYDWNTDNGRENLGTWVEEAFQAREIMLEEKEIEKSDDDENDDGRGDISMCHLPQNPSTGPVVVNRPPAQPWCNVEFYS